MAQLSDFDEIRPYSDEEVRIGIRTLLADRQFKTAVKAVVPWLPYPVSKAIIRLLLIGVKTTLGFQIRVMRPVAKSILRKKSDGYTYTPNPNNTWDKRYTFISNHRDIILDIATFNLLLYGSHAPAICQIAIGDNLLIYPWIKHLVRLNKAFVVRRSLPPKEMLQSSILMSQYMHFVIKETRENIWIAQREGRSKDSSDNTQEGVIKMITLGDDVAPIDSLREMNIVPLTISYEFDPCDFLKAQEFQLKRDNPKYKKSRQDDLINMRTGIFGYKGRIVFRTANCINEWLDELKDLPHQEFFREITARLDREIHSNYEIYPNNYVALDLLNGNNDNADHYSEGDVKRFEDYLEGQLNRVVLPNKDIPFLRERMLTMYANPLRNYRQAKAETTN